MSVRQSRSVSEAAALVNERVRGMHGIWVRGEIIGARSDAGDGMWLTVTDGQRWCDIHLNQARRRGSRIDFRRGVVLDVDARPVPSGRGNGWYWSADWVELVSERGEIAAGLARVERALRAEGVKVADESGFDFARWLPRRPPPRSLLALVPRHGGEGWGDVKRQLPKSVSVTSEKVGGKGRSMAQGSADVLRSSRIDGHDAVLIVRGGGSKGELLGFDDEELARAVAASPVPVYTAIGHASDVSLVDRVATAAFATPHALGSALSRSHRQPRPPVRQAHEVALQAALARSADDSGRVQAAELNDLRRVNQRLLDERAWMQSGLADADCWIDTAILQAAARRAREHAAAQAAGLAVAGMLLAGVGLAAAWARPGVWLSVAVVLQTVAVGVARRGARAARLARSSGAPHEPEARARWRQGLHAARTPRELRAVVRRPPD